jgi:CRP/FNR family transcriptional regulator, cyclic AMP receptor protein
MFIRQAELFEGVSSGANGVIDRQKRKQSYKEGGLVFQEGDAAQYLYILEEGKVDLFVGRQEEMHFLVYYPGEIFGWSALVKPHQYLAHARCVTDCTVSRVPKQAIDDEIVKDYPTDGLLIYKNLAAILGQRLIAAYRDRGGIELKQVGYGG